jgi:hypothetical protein
MDMKNCDDDHEDEASISLRDINIPGRSDWCKVSSITIDTNNPFYIQLAARQHKMEHSFSMRSSVSDDEATGSCMESRNFESLFGEESIKMNSAKLGYAASVKSSFTRSCMDSRNFESLFGGDESVKMTSAKANPTSAKSSFKCEEFVLERSDSGKKWLPSWKKSMLDCLRDFDMNEKPSIHEEELLSSKLEQAIDVGLKVVDREEKRLLRRQSARLSMRSEQPVTELLTITEALNESQQSQDEIFGKRMSRGLSLLEKERSILLSLKQDSVSFDGNAAQYFSWTENHGGSSFTDVDGDQDSRASRGMSLLEEARKAVTHPTGENDWHDVTIFSSNDDIDFSKEEGANTNDEKLRAMALLDKHRALLSFCFNDVSNGEDAAIFKHGEDSSADDSCTAKKSE